MNICPVNAATGQQVVKGTGEQEGNDDDHNPRPVQVGSREALRIE
jgi:hypothetical protein